MKINRFIALAAIALLIVGAMGFLSYRSFAQTGPTPTTSEADEANEATEANEGQEGAEASEAAEANETLPTDTVISADQAQALVKEANPGTAVLGVEYDSDSSTGVWEVELDNGQDVKVNATTGEILPGESDD